MKVNEAKNYIEKAVVKIDEIQKRLNEPSASLIPIVLM